MKYNGHNIDTPVTKISEIPRVFQFQIGRKIVEPQSNRKEKVVLKAPYEACKVKTQSKA